jgi:hypothetical protein
VSRYRNRGKSAPSSSSNPLILTRPRAPAPPAQKLTPSQDVGSAEAKLSLSGETMNPDINYIDRSGSALRRAHAVAGPRDDRGLEPFLLVGEVRCDWPGRSQRATGRAGLQILRDSHDVAHIYGRTRDDVMFGSGWVAAEGRGILLLEGFGPAYLTTLDVPGVDPTALGPLTNTLARMIPVSATPSWDSGWYG